MLQCMVTSVMSGQTYGHIYSSMYSPVVFLDEYLTVWLSWLGPGVLSFCSTRLKLHVRVPPVIVTGIIGVYTLTIALQYLCLARCPQIKLVN